MSKLYAVNGELVCSIRVNLIHDIHKEHVVLPYPITAWVWVTSKDNVKSYSTQDVVLPDQDPPTLIKIMPFHIYGFFTPIVPIAESELTDILVEKKEES